MSFFLRPSNSFLQTSNALSNGRFIFCGLSRLLQPRLLSELAQIDDRTFGAPRFAGETDVATVQDQPVMSVLLEFIKHYFQKFVFDHAHIIATRDARTIRYTKDVRVDGDRRMTERCVQDHVCGLTSHAG